MKGFLPSSVITRYQTDAAYAEMFHTVIRNFFHVLFTRNIVFHMSAFCWMILCIVIAVFTIFFAKDPLEKKKALCVNLCMLLGFWLYNLFLLWTYLTTMSHSEAVGVVCYGRYIGTYLIGWFALSGYLLFSYQAGALKVQYLYLGVFFLCNIWGFLDRNTYFKEIGIEVRESYEASSYIKECIPEVTYDDSADMPDLWISYAEEEAAPNGEQIHQLRYYLFPEFDFININIIQKDYQQQMQDIVAEFSFDYVVLYGVNEDFYDAYYWFFADGLSNAREQYENGRCQAYKVIKDESTGEFRWFEPIL
ncbi:MAG: hypothetical protein NC318_06565 [Blautia sp.]|nr:hypothetical protein [Blautia sp.]